MLLVGGAIAVTAALRPGLIWGAAVALSIVTVLALELVKFRHGEPRSLSDDRALGSRKHHGTHGSGLHQKHDRGLSD